MSTATPVAPEVKSGHKTTEMWLVVLACGALVWVLTQLQAQLPALADAVANPIVKMIVPLAQMGIAALITFLTAWYVKHRTDLKMGLPDASPIITLSDAVKVLQQPAKVLALVLVGALTLMSTRVLADPLAVADGGVVLHLDSEPPIAAVVIEVHKGDVFSVPSDGAFMDTATIIQKAKDQQELEALRSAWTVPVWVMLAGAGASLAAGAGLWAAFGPKR